MQINKRFFSEIELDNDAVFLENLIGIVESVDELSSMEVTKSFNGLHFRIAPSLPKYNDMLLEEILKFHNMFGIHLDLSKSIKTSSVLNFSILT
jgi:hypothetical protein